MGTFRGPPGRPPQRAHPFFTPRGSHLVFSLKMKEFVVWPDKGPHGVTETTDTKGGIIDPTDTERGRGLGPMGRSGNVKLCLRLREIHDFRTNDHVVAPYDAIAATSILISAARILNTYFVGAVCSGLKCKFHEHWLKPMEFANKKPLDQPSGTNHNLLHQYMIPFVQIV